MEQNKPGMLAGRDLAGKCRARARGLSECGGVQDDLLPVAAPHREMSLGSHGNDREIDRAQHLFCHGAEEQLADLAPAPGAKKYTICLELSNRGGDLLRGIAFAHHDVAEQSVCLTRQCSHHGSKIFAAELEGAGGS